MQTSTNKPFYCNSIGEDYMAKKIEYVDIPDNKVEEFKALLSKTWISGRKCSSGWQGLSGRGNEDLWND